MTSLISKNLLIYYRKIITSYLIINLIIFSFNIFKVAKVVLSMEADLPITVNTSRLIIIDLTVYRLNWDKMIVGDRMIKHVNGREVSGDESVKIRCHSTSDRLLARNLIWSSFIPVLMTFKIKLTRFKTLERSFLRLKKLILTMKYKLLSQVSFTKMIKASRKKLRKSTEKWRIYVKVKESSS